MFQQDVRGVADIEKLAFEGKDAVVVAANHGQARHDHRLGGVPLGDDEGAVLQPGGPGVVGVVQLGDAGVSLVFIIPSLRLRAWFIRYLAYNMTETTALDFYTSLRNLLESLTEKKTEGCVVMFYFVLCLAIKRGFLHEAVGEDGKVVFDLGQLDVGPPVVLLLHDCLDLLCHLAAW